MSELNAEELQKQLEELKAQNENLLNSKRRVEEENSKYKKRAQDVESKLTEVEKKKLEEENKIHELLKIEREEKERLLKDHLELKNSTLREKLRNEVTLKAKDAHNVDDILRVVEAKQALKIDEETLSIEGVEDFVSKVRELRPHFFAKPNIKSNEELPPNKENGKGESTEEAYRRELRAAKSQKDFEKVREKYGKSNY